MPDPAFVRAVVVDQRLDQQAADIAAVGTGLTQLNDVVNQHNTAANLRMNQQAADIAAVGAGLTQLNDVVNQQNTAANCA